MAPLKPGSVTGYRAAGRELRADAGKPSARGAGGSHRPASPYSPPSPLLSPGKPAKASASVRLLVQHVQRAQFALRKTFPGTPASPPPGNSSGTTWTATQVHPAYGGAAYNNGGGRLAGAISGSAGSSQTGQPGAGNPAGSSAPRPANVIQGTAEEISRQVRNRRMSASYRNSKYGMRL